MAICIYFQIVYKVAKYIDNNNAVSLWKFYVKGNTILALGENCIHVHIAESTLVVGVGLVKFYGELQHIKDNGYHCPLYAGNLCLLQ